MTNKLTSPKVHFSPASGWINDPNGLVYFDGEYHLFYQHHPDSLVWGPMHWGHAVSSDLINWQELDIALYPGVEGACFSGSAVVDKHNCTGLFSNGAGLVALYTSHLEDESFDRGYIQQQCLAYSDDSGRSWQKYAGNPVIASPGFSDFRDPKVIWHEATQSWIQLLAAGQEIHLYRSANLRDWEYLSRFGAGQGAHSEGAWECPDLFELPIQGSDKSYWVLLVGMVPPDEPLGSYTQYFIGDFDGRSFTNLNSAQTVLRMDEGRDFYAVQSWSDTPDSRRLAIAWMSNWHYANEVPAQEYRGNMTLVRELALRETTQGVRLVQQFVVPHHPSLSAITADLGKGSFVGIEASGARVGQMVLSMEPGSRVSLAFFDGEPQVEIEQYSEGCRLWIYRRVASVDSAQYSMGLSEISESFTQKFEHEYAVELGLSEEIELTWVTDLNTLELLIDRGRVAVSQLVLADSCGEPVRVELLRGSAQLIQFGECPL